MREINESRKNESPIAKFCITEYVAEYNTH